MNKAWAMVIIAACFEVGWVIGMKYADSPWEWFATIIAILVSFYVMIAASKTIPVGTVYAVFVGLGTAGTVLAEMIIFHAEVKPVKLALLALLLAGVVILKLQSNEKEQTAVTAEAATNSHQVNHHENSNKEDC